MQDDNVAWWELLLSSLVFAVIVGCPLWLALAISWIRWG